MNNWDKRFMDMAELVSTWTSCARQGRAIGAIIVKDKRILTTGYNGAPRGRKNCVDLGYCTREQLKVPRGERYELCRSVHAEANAIISAQRRDMVGATIYLVGRDARSGELLHDATSCPMCRRMIINAGIKGVLNFTSTRLNFPQGIYVENYDITTLLEKVAYCVKESEENNDNN